MRFALKIPITFLAALLLTKLATGPELGNELTTGEAGKFAAAEIRRAAAASGVTFDDDAKATRISYASPPHTPSPQHPIQGPLDPAPSKAIS
jgi:hypothetical protein